MLLEKDKDKDNPLESKIERSICSYAKSRSFYVKKFVSPSNRSVPDDLFISPHGYVFFIEFKRKSLKPTAAQEQEHKLIRANGVEVYIIDNIESGRELIDALSHR